MRNTPNKDLAWSIKSLRDVRIEVQILIGHSALNYHMHKLGQNNTAEYKAYGEKEKTFLCILLSYAKLRIGMLASAFFEPK